jgi:DNA-directed RNA polymerase specialized sigma24 family protein
VVSVSHDVTPASPDETWSLSSLQQGCQEELTRYRKATHKQESRCCLEIVRRAAAEDDEALAALLQLSQQLVQNRCPSDLRALQDDMAQNLAERLLHVFRKRGHPFHARTFAEYRAYLNLTYHSVVIETRKAHPPEPSLDLLHAAGFDKAGAVPMAAVDRRMLQQRLLELLPDDRMRDAFRRRTTAGESPEEIAQALGTTKKETYRLLEKATRYLKKCAEVRDMLEE